MTRSRSTARLALHSLALIALLATPSREAAAQVRERPVPFDSVGRIIAITPPLAARLGLAPPVWPVSGDYIDARLYSIDDTSAGAVLVVRRPREVLERYPLSATQRIELGAAVDRGVVAQRAAGGPDSLATRISDPVRGWFVANQTALGVALFGPFAAVLAGNAAGGTAAYLAVAGGTFFIAADLWRDEGSRRAAAALVLGAGVVGYPLGLRYARTGAYRVTAGDVGTLVAGELLGMTTVATFIPQNIDNERQVAAFLAGGFVLGAIAADRLVVRRFDYGEAESRLLQLGTAAGAVVGLAVPVLAESDNPQAIFGPATAGGILGAILTHRLLAPARERSAAAMRTGRRPEAERFTLRFTPQSLLLARSGQRGSYPVLSATF